MKKSRRFVGSVILSFMFLGSAYCGSSSTGSEQDWKLGENRVVLTSAELSADGAVTSGKGVEFRLAVPLGVERSRIALGARDALVVGSSARVVERGKVEYGLVTGLGSVEVKQGAEVGVVYAGNHRPATVRADAKIHGFLRTSGTAIQEGTAKVDVGVIENADSPLEEYRWNVAFPTTNLGDRIAGSDGVEDLVPGAYGAVAAAPGSTIRIHTGTYYVDSLRTSDGATLDIDNAQGPVYLWVRNSLELSSMMVGYGPGSNTMVGYAGSASPRIAGAFHGTLIAPAADLVLPAAAQPHRGSFFAKSIQLMDGVALLHEPFQADVDAPAVADEMDNFIPCAVPGPACSDLCLGAGASCSGYANHPYSPSSGSGALYGCRPGFPTWTCSFQYSNGDNCTVIQPTGTWLCLYH